MYYETSNDAVIEFAGKFWIGRMTNEIEACTQENMYGDGYGEIYLAKACIGPYSSRAAAETQRTDMLAEIKAQAE